MNKTKVKLTISSIDLTSEEICDAVGLTCDQEWKIGDQRGKTIIREKENGCMFESTLPESSPLEDHVDALISRLKPYSEKIKTLSKTNEVEFSCVIYNYIDPVNPGFHFEKGIISDIHSLGADLDIDLYLLGKEEGEV
jgi:hypothetical protein